MSLATDTSNQPAGASGSVAVPAPQRGRRHLSAGESMIRGVLANFSVQPVTWASSLLAAAVVPRFLGSDGVGQLAIAFTISALAKPVLDLGFVSYLTRQVAQHPARARHDLGVALIAQVAIYSIGAVAIALLAPIIAPGLRDVRILYWALGELVFICTQMLLTTVLRGQEKHIRYAWLCAVPEVVSAVGAAFILFFGADVLTYAAAGVLFGVLGIAISWRVAGISPAWPALDLTFLHEVRCFIRGGLPFLTFNLTMTFYGAIDRLLLAFFVPSAEVGWYSEAYRIIAIPVFFPSLLITPLFPVLSRATSAETMRRAITQTLRVGLIVTVPLCAGLCVVAPAIPGLLGWPEDFSHAVISMQILALQIPVVGIDMVLGTVVMALGRERQLVRAGLAAGVLNVACNLIAIPFFEHIAGNGPIGASIVTGLTEVWMFFAAIILIPKHLRDSRLIWLSMRVALAAMAAAVLAMQVLPVVSLVGAALAGSVTYAILAALLQVVSIEDVRYVTERLQRLTVRPPLETR